MFLSIKTSSDQEDPIANPGESHDSQTGLKERIHGREGGDREWRGGETVEVD